jgi:dihydroorotate dehydrogenase electron transfer subunit
MNEALCKVVANDRLTPFLCRLECESDLVRDARAGQFVLVFPPRDSILLGRAFAVAERTECSFAVWYMVAGRGTHALTELKPGDKVRVRGPLGNSFPEPDGNNRLHVVMGAVGAAALTLDDIRQADDRQAGNKRAYSGQTELYLGVPDGSWRPFVEMLSQRVADRKGQSLRVFSEDGSLGKKGDALSELPGELSPGDRVWGCGPYGMMKALALRYEKRRSQVFLSLDAKMACGYGGCLGCVVDTVSGKKRACADGPVFRADEVIWDGD